MQTFAMPSLTVNFIYFGVDAPVIYADNALRPGTPFSAGIDLRVCMPEGQSVTVAPGERHMFHTGIGIEMLLPGVAGFVFSRSGLGALKGMTVAQGVGLIDADYRGEITVPLLNTSQTPYTVARGERIAQLVFLPYFTPEFIHVDKLGDTGRGAGGFGHTGHV